MDFARETKGSHCPRCVWPYVFQGQGVDNAFALPKLARRERVQLTPFLHESTIAP